MDWRAVLTRHAAERAAAVLHRRMARGLAGLRTVAGTAPLVGMLGTVWSIAEWSSIRCVPDCGDVAGSPAEIFVPMAFGLAVGIVASWGYRYLTARMAGFDVEMRNAALSGRTGSGLCDSIREEPG